MIGLKTREGIGRWVLQQTGDSAPFNVTLGFTATDLTHAQGFINQMNLSWGTRLKSSTTTNITLVETNGLWFDGTNEHSLFDAAGVAGTGGTGVLPSNCALLVGKDTSYAGRKYRGRMYWPSMLASGSVDPNGNVDATVLATLQGHFTDLFADLQLDPSAVPVLLHDKITGGVLDTTPATPLTAFTVRNKIGTQRRRMRGT